MHERNLSRKRATHLMQSQSEREVRRASVDASNQHRDVAKRKASVNELSEGVEQDERKNEDLSKQVQQHYGEFLQWMEAKRTSDEEKVQQQQPPSQSEKVNVINETRAVVNEAINVVANENPPAVSEKLQKSDIDFDEFKDAISDEEDDAAAASASAADDYLNVALLIQEDGDDNDNDETLASANELSEDDEPLSTATTATLATVIELRSLDSNALSDAEQQNAEEETIAAKITLSNVAPLTVVLTSSLSSSNISLASSTTTDKSVDELGNKKRAATHSKGKAPPPPAAAAAKVVNVIPGHFYDQVTEKYFKETEL